MGAFKRKDRVVLSPLLYDDDWCWHKRDWKKYHCAEGFGFASRLIILPYKGSIMDFSF